MMMDGYLLGGEQSGHIILQKYATTGDGILTALMLMEEILDRKSTLGKLASPVKIFPQSLINIKVPDKDAVMNDEHVKSIVREIEEELGENGRILLRKSGTENVIRVMVECENEEQCNSCAEKAAAYIRERYGK